MNANMSKVTVFERQNKSVNVRSHFRIRSRRQLISSEVWEVLYKRMEVCQERPA